MTEQPAETAVDEVPTTPAPPAFRAAAPDADPAPGDELADATALEGLVAELDAVERALARLDEGTYGTCEACGAEIADDALAVAPAAARCAEHAA